LAKALEKEMAVQDNATKAYLARVEKSFRRDYDGELPSPLVVPSSDAKCLEPDRIPNPARIGPLLSLPTKSFEISLQQIPGHGATDLQRHAHEAVHYVRLGHGYSEIGGTPMTGDLAILYTLRRGRSIGTTTSIPSRPNSSSLRIRNSKRLACMKERVSAS
jgi:hypothetical protein